MASATDLNANQPKQSTGAQVKRLMVYGFLFVVLLGGPMHFVFEWSGRSPLVGAVAPVNESVWEHLKLAFLPTLIWYLTTYRRVRADTGIRQPAIRWLLAAAVSVLVSFLFVMTFYYTYTGAFDFESLALDALSFVIGVALGQMLALHVYRHARPSPASRIFAVAVPLILLAAFIAFTFATPRIPLFLDQPTGTYGIWMAK